MSFSCGKSQEVGTRKRNASPSQQPIGRAKQIVKRSNFFLACSHNFELQTSNFKLSRSARQHPPNRAYNSPKILLTQVAPRRQAQSALEKLVGNAASVVRGVFEHRLEMHGLPERTTFDILRFEGQSYIFRCRFDEITEEYKSQQ